LIPRLAFARFYRFRLWHIATHRNARFGNHLPEVTLCSGVCLPATRLIIDGIENHVLPGPP